RQADLDWLHAFLRDHEVKVVILDPTHRALFGEGSGTCDGRSYDIGPRLAAAAGGCLAAGATPGVVHPPPPADRGGEGMPSVRTHLGYQGVAACARQWLLVDHRKPYQPVSRQHCLGLVAGSNAGDSTSWNVDIQEGSGSSDGEEKGWSVTVST